MLHNLLLQLGWRTWIVYEPPADHRHWSMSLSLPRRPRIIAIFILINIITIIMAYQHHIPTIQKHIITIFTTIIFEVPIFISPLLPATDQCPSHTHTPPTLIEIGWQLFYCCRDNQDQRQSAIMVSLECVIENQDTHICINLDSVSAFFTAVTLIVSHFFNLLPGLFASTSTPPWSLSCLPREPSSYPHTTTITTFESIWWPGLHQESPRSIALRYVSEASAGSLLISWSRPSCEMSFDCHPESE